MFTPAQLWRNWREQRPSNEGDLDSGVTGDVWRVYYMGVDLILLLGCVLNSTHCIFRFSVSATNVNFIETHFHSN
jgi:hypothetical protein